MSGDGSEKKQFIQTCTDMLESRPKLWVRARTGAGSRSSLPVTSTEQAGNWIEWWIKEKNLDWSDFQVSEFLPGEEYALQTIWQDGLLVSAEARVRISYLYGFLSPSGQSSTPSVARTTSKPEVYKLGLKAIRALDQHPNGVFCVDMKTDYDSVIKVTEINAGRFFTTSNFFAHAGVNMPEMSIRAAAGEKLTPIGAGTLGEDLFWIRMVDMGFKLVHRSEIDSYARVRDL
jgi:carbamoyl-phosphate synthase large subunit